MLFIMCCMYFTDVFCEMAGKVEIQIDHVHNLYGILRNSSCCAGKRDRTKSVSEQCSEPCNTFLTFCVSSDFKSNCNFGRYETKVLGYDSFKLPLSSNMTSDFSELRGHLSSGAADFKNLITFVIPWKAPHWPSLVRSFFNIFLIFNFAGY